MQSYINKIDFKKVGRNLTIAGAAITGAFGMMIKEASAAQEITARFGTVFQDVFSQASKSAKDLADNYGLSTKAAEDMLGATGDLLTGLGMQSDIALTLSEETQQLAVDLASFTNYSGGAKGASEALTKAMLGERESIKSLGIVITEEMVKEHLLKEGKEKLTGQALLQAKAEATLAIAVRQSKNAIGDYERTSESFANVTRTLKATLNDLFVLIGSDLIPVATDLAKKIKEIVGNISDWIKENSELTGRVIKISAVVGGLLLALGPLLIILPSLATGFGLVTGAILLMTKTSLAFIATPLGATLGALTIAAAGFYYWQKKINEKTREALGLYGTYFDKLNAIEDELKALGVPAKEWIKLTTDFAYEMAEMERSYKAGKISLATYRADMAAFFAPIEEYRDKFKELQETMSEGIVTAKEKMTGATTELGQSLPIIRLKIKKNLEMPFVKVAKVAEDSMHDIDQGWKNTLMIMDGISGQMVGMLSGAFTEMADSGKSAFKVLEAAFKNMLINMLSQIAAKAAIFALFNLILPGGGIAGGALKFIFGEKGVTLPGSFVPIASAQTGGTFSKPTLALIAEGGAPERVLNPRETREYEQNRIPQYGIGGDTFNVTIQTFDTETFKEFLNAGGREPTIEFIKEATRWREL